MATMPILCKYLVPLAHSSRMRQCRFHAKKDGFCIQHHPDTIRARNEAKYEKFRGQQARVQASVEQRQKDMAFGQRMREILSKHELGDSVSVRTHSEYVNVGLGDFLSDLADLFDAES